jgi:penicillin V acylase-like amidase (Ntn superfamily)
MNPLLVKTKQTCRHFLIALIGSIVATQTPVDACTRALYVAKDGTILTGRSMDWGEDMHSNIWVLPREMQRNGGGGKNTVTWKSKFGSLVTSAYDIGTSDGMNEKGLVVNMLALVESDYGRPAEGGKVICMSTWAQYILDNHATVAEAVADLRKELFRVQTIDLPTGRPANMHLAISDATGDSAIFEYVKGKLVIHHGKTSRC